MIKKPPIRRMVMMSHVSLPLGSSAHISTKPRKMGFSLRQKKVLKVVHPGRHVEVFSEPITAGEIMRKYPRHCITRPDVFEFPWIVVRPEALLVPGKVFYLVPHHTMYGLIKAKIQQIQSVVSSNHHHLDMHNSHINSSRYPLGQDSCTGSLYKLEFYRSSWNKMRRKLYKGKYNERLDSEFYSPFDRIRSSSNKMRIVWGPFSRSEKSELIRLRPCLRKPDSSRQRLNLRVRFA